MPRAYRWLVRVLPEAFREEYGEEICRVAEEHWAAVKDSLGPWGRARFWARQTAALIGAAARLRNDENGRGGMEGLMQDLGQAARALLKRPGFALVTTVTLGLGIGATTAIFSAVHAVLLRDLPYQDPDRVAVLFQTDLTTGERAAGVSAPNIRDLNEQSRLLGPVSVAEPWSLDLELEGRAETLRTWTVSVGFFEALGSRPFLGRTFLEGEYVEGNDKVVMLSHGSWTHRFGADPTLVGGTVSLDNEPYTVVGVLPATFKFPDGAEAWIPRPPRAWDAQSRASDFLTGVARLAPGASLAEAQSELDGLARALGEAYPETNATTGVQLVPLREHLFGEVRSPLLVIMGAIAFVLLIACANVAGLMLARGAQRRREYAVRGALGASRGRLVRQIGAESMILALAGCVLGVGLTFLGVRLIESLGPDHLPRIDELSVDGTVLIFAAAMAGLSALFAGLLPAWSLSRPDLAGALSDASRGSSVGAEGTRLRRRLVVAEVAAAVVLLVGSGLLLRSFGVLTGRSLGFDPEGRLAVQIFAYDYAPGELTAFVRTVLEEIEGIPGVRRVALGSDVPGATDGTIAKIDIVVPYTVADRPAPPAGQEPNVAIGRASHGYFDVLGIPLVEGRGFEEGDRQETSPVVVVNETFARRTFGERSALGERVIVRFGGDPIPREIVGVVGDVRPLGHASDPRAELYFPLSQVGSGSLTFVVEGEGDPALLATPVTEAIWKGNPSQSVWGVATLDELLADWLRERTFNLVLLTAFAGVALVLAVVGIYGLVSFSVERRLGELGIRRALGGTASHIVGMVLREGAVLAATGTAIGLVGALWLTRFLSGMLYGVEPTDPLTFVGLGAGALVIATLAALLPALRATRVDPVVALRQE